MPAKRKKKKKSAETPLDGLFPLYPVASATEATGLIPALPATDFQAEAYADLMDISPQKADAHPENGDPPVGP